MKSANIDYWLQRDIFKDKITLELPFNNKGISDVLLLDTRAGMYEQASCQYFIMLAWPYSGLIILCPHAAAAS